MHALRVGIPHSRHSLRHFASLFGPGSLRGDLRISPGAVCATAPAAVSSARAALSADWASSARMSAKHGADAVVEGAAKQARTENGRALAPADALRVKRLSENATLPARGSAGAAGYDLSSAEDTVVPARGKAIVKTDLQIGIPEGTYARIAPRSGLAAKHSIDVGAGVVDYDYRGNVGVILFNLSDAEFKISVGDRIAQLILERISTPPVQEVDDLESTERGAGGFGSTGVAAK